MTNPPRFRTLSIPRSGNVLLLRYLHAYYFFRSNTGQTYRLEVDSLTRDLVQLSSRSHDTRLQEPLDTPGTATIVQYRDPLPQFLSYVERTELHRPGTFSSSEFAHRWAAKNALYFVQFVRKWLHPPGPESLVIHYEDLVSDPWQRVLQVCSLLGEEVNVRGLEQAVMEVSGNTVRDKALTRHSSRDDRQSPIVPMSLARAFDVYVRKNTPWIAWPSPSRSIEEPAQSAFEAMVKRVETERRRKASSPLDTADRGAFNLQGADTVAKLS